MVVKVIKYPLLLLLTILMLADCNDSYNFKEATLQEVNGKICIKLSGKRKLLMHSPKDIAGDNTYTDSLLIYTSVLKEGAITDIEIPVAEGDYQYQRTIFKKRNELTVDVFIVNTTENRLVPSDWNGHYDLLK
jgi:hypothetical protein